MKSNANPKFTTLVIAMALGAGSLQAYAFGTADDVDETVYTTAFKALDTNSNGTLTRSEAEQEEIFAKHFSAADKDNDSALDQEEYTDYRTKVEQKNTKRVASDSVITSKVKGRLLKDEGMKSLKVSVKTYQGVVLLSGFVETEDQIQQAEKIAAETEGVKSVKNSLMLKKD